MEIIMPVPFQPFTGESGMVPKAVDDSRNATGEGDPGITHSEPQSITCPYFYRDSAFLRQTVQFDSQRNYKTVKISPCEILQVNPGNYANVQRGFDYGKKLLHCLFSGHF